MNAYSNILDRMTLDELNELQISLENKKKELQDPLYNKEFDKLYESYLTYIKCNSGVVVSDIKISDVEVYFEFDQLQLKVIPRFDLTDSLCFKAFENSDIVKNKIKEIETNLSYLNDEIKLFCDKFNLESAFIKNKLFTKYIVEDV